MNRLFPICSTFLICLALSVVSPSVHADVVWDEGIQGDLSNFESAPTDVLLVVGENEFIGTVGGTSNPNNGDGFDSFLFVVNALESVDSIIIDDYQVFGGNLSTGFNIFQSDGTYLGGLAMNTSHIGQDVLSLTGIGPLGPGGYYISLREFTAPGQVYRFTMNVSTTAIPEPDLAFPFCLFLTLAVVASTGFRRRSRILPSRSA